MFSLDADYTGEASVWYPFPPNVAVYAASGSATSAPNGLNSVTLSLEGSFNPYDEVFSQNDPSSIRLLTDAGDGFEGTSWIPGLWSFWGSGPARSLEGKFTAYGTGRFQGSTAGGTFHVRTGEPADWPFRAPATISIRGTSTSPIPEPSSLALLGLAGVTLLPAFRDRFRPGT